MTQFITLTAYPDMRKVIVNTRNIVCLFPLNVGCHVFLVGELSELKVQESFEFIGNHLEAKP